MRARRGGAGRAARPGRAPHLLRATWCVALLAASTVGCGHAGGGPEVLPPVYVEPPPSRTGRAAVDALEFPPLRFTPPEPRQVTLANGATLFYLEDATLPLVDVQVRFRGGASHFPRELYGAAVAVAGLIRSGGTAGLSPDSVDALVEQHAWSISFGSGGRMSFGGFGSLARNAEAGLHLFAEMIMHPRFDAERVEVWRGRELESVRRRQDSPGFFAATEFNRLMYGEHPVGWVIEADDLDPEDLSGAALRRVHEAVYCPEQVVFGVTGALPLEEAVRMLESAFAGWRPCPAPLEEPPPPDVRDAGGVFLIARPLSQSTVYMGHGSALRQGPTREYFASRIANAILGASGFTSRLVREVRTERGLAYGAGSFWTTPEENEGIFGATTSTRAPATVEAVRVMTEVIAGMTEAPPSPEEVGLAIMDIVNGFVFNFESPAQIVGRRMLYHQEGLPGDWLERYLDGVQAVTPADVHRVMSEFVHPERFTILILGDPAAMDPPPATLGEVVELRAEERRRAPGR